MAARRNDPDDPTVGLPSSGEAVELRAVPEPTSGDGLDENAEANLLGHILAGTLDPATIPAEMFAAPKNRHIHAAALTAQQHGPVDPLTVVRELQTAGTFTKVVQIAGNAYPFDLVAERVGDPAYWKRLCTEAAERRRLLAAGRRFVQRLERGDNPDQVNDALWTTFTELQDPGHRLSVREPSPDIDTFLATDEPDHAWVIPGFLEQGDRLILTAGEGHGKTTLLRQLAVQAAAGIHPFTYEHVDPVRVLVLDLENSTRQNRREYRPLRIQAGDNLNPEHLRLEHRLDGIDLTTDTDRRWLGDLIAAARPDLLITGPIYKMAAGDPNEEKSAKPVAMHLDHLRAEHGITVCLEAHSPKAVAAARRRPHEPYGWSGWMRWPEFGLWLDEQGALMPWRGARDATRAIPAALERGGIWPWTAVHDQDELRWQRIRSFILEVGEMPTQRDIAEVLGTSVSTINAVLKKRDPQLRKLLDGLQGDPE